MVDSLPDVILQFGTGRFLRAFVDLFVHETNETSQPLGRVLVVQSTGSERAARFNAQQGRYHVAVRGLRDGRSVDEVVQVQSVRLAFAADKHWSEVLAAAGNPALRAIVSNVTEAGYSRDANDSCNDHPPTSFPAKLLLTLQSRFHAGVGGITVLPCELVDRNADRLRELVLEQASAWDCDSKLVEWLREACQWRNTLVDRIVSTPSSGDPLAADDPLSAVAEPFASWLVEGMSDLPILAGHASVERVDRLEPYHLRKVRILNGAHTALVAKARPMGFQTVRAAALDPTIAGWLRQLLFDEIVPTLEGRTDAPAGFAERVLERFANPFLEHRLADIALYHEVKVQSRLLPTALEYRDRFGHWPPLLKEIV